MPPDCSNAPIATWTKIYNEVVSPLCGNSCHNGGTSDTKGGGLDLFPHNPATSVPCAPNCTRAYGNLVNQAPKSGYMCFGKGMRVVKGNPEMSIVYQKLTNQQTCGAAMPHGMADGTVWATAADWKPLPTSQICDFYTWIKAGANNN